MSGRPIIACVGAGRMGRGMAHCFAYAGHEVRLLDIKPRDQGGFEALKTQALGEIEKTLTMLTGLGAFEAAAIPRIVARISVLPADEAGAALSDADFVFEGVPETEDAKRDAFALIDRHAGPETVITSTTSTFLSTMLAEMVADRSRFLNAHWLNPAYIVPLVELSPTPETDPAVTARTKALLEGIGKVPVVCAASPGYIVPRIQALAMNEAARMVEEGVASAEEIDKAVKYGFGFRFAVLGLLEFIDWGGGDILYYASRYMAQATGEDRFKAPEIVERNMAEGRLGLRSGEGFYDYKDMDVSAYQAERLKAFLAALENSGLSRPPE